MTPTNVIDKRKARIVASLYPTRINRGFKTSVERDLLAKCFGVSGRMLGFWENGEHLPHDEQLPAIEKWLASSPVWRYDRIDHVVGPESWPKPLKIPSQTPPVKAPGRAGVSSGRLSACEVGVKP